MHLVSFERLRHGGPDCPSDVMLHRLRAGELQRDRAEALRRHLDECARCAALVARHAAGFAAWPEVDPVRMLASIRRRAGQGPEAPAGGWRSRARALLMPLASAAAAAAAVLVVLSGPSWPEPTTTTRLKGGPVLHVYRQQGGAAVEATSGDRFAPGEPLQLTVDVPAEGLVQIVGVEADGDLYPIWPRDGAAPFASMGAGQGQRVPGAVALDDGPGPETFHLVTCPLSAGASPSCRSQGAGKPLDCPAGCASSPFVIQRG